MQLSRRKNCRYSAILSPPNKFFGRNAKVRQKKKENPALDPKVWGWKKKSPIVRIDRQIIALYARPSVKNCGASMKILWNSRKKKKIHLSFLSLSQISVTSLASTNVFGPKNYSAKNPIYCCYYRHEINMKNCCIEINNNKSKVRTYSNDFLINFISWLLGFSPKLIHC